MFWKSAAAALAALTLWTAPAAAQDEDHGAKVFRLGDASAFASDREEGADDDTLLVAHRHYGGYRGGYHGYRGYHGGYYGHRGYHGGYRHYGPRVSFSFGYPYYRSYYSYYRPYYSYYRPSFYYRTPVYYYSYPSYYSYGYYCPISMSAPAVFGGSSREAYPSQQTVPPMQKADDFSQPPPIPPEESTFPYNGGPNAPVPRIEPQKAAPIDPTQGRVVSLPIRLPKYSYPAYGEKAMPAAASDDAVKAVRR